MTNKYEIIETLNVNAEAARRANNADTLRKQLANLWMKQFEDFWRTPLTHGDSALTIVEMQSILDAMGSVALDMLLDSAAFAEFLSSNHSDLLSGDDPFVPARYLSAPYNYSLIGGQLQLDSLKEEWEIYENVE